MPIQQSAKPRLQITSEGKRYFIQVPTGHAEALLGFLRRNGVYAEPPSPCSSDVDNIELGKQVNSTAVQSLLDRWD